MPTATTTATTTMRMTPCRRANTATGIIMSRAVTATRMCRTSATSIRTEP